MTKNDRQGIPRIAKNTEKSTLENLKYQKNVKKKKFFEEAIFRAKKASEKNSKKDPLGLNPHVLAQARGSDPPPNPPLGR